MMDDDDDDDFVLDDGDDEETNAELTNSLCIGAPVPKPEMLNVLEQQYRRDGQPLVMFVETADDGSEIFGNAAEYAKAMDVPPDVVPTMAQADQWVWSRPWPRWEW
jgi:hypothetical protein